MPDFADFASASGHRDGNLVVRRTGDLTNREVNVAIRVVYDRKTLLLNLHGLKGPEPFGSVYMSRDQISCDKAA